MCPQGKDLAPKGTELATDYGFHLGRTAQDSRKHNPHGRKSAFPLPSSLWNPETKTREAGGNVSLPKVSLKELANILSLSPPLTFPHFLPRPTLPDHLSLSLRFFLPLVSSLSLLTFSILVKPATVPVGLVASLSAPISLPVYACLSFPFSQSLSLTLCPFLSLVSLTCSL